MQSLEMDTLQFTVSEADTILISKINVYTLYLDLLMLTENFHYFKADTVILSLYFMSS